jgi:NADH dehydrogenase FAD-containing subunit
MRVKTRRSPRPRIVIVGANFAGLTAATRFGRQYDVTVIDPSPWFEWLPNVHELVSGVKRPGDLRLSRARVLARAGHRFVRTAVTSIDAPAGRLVTADRRRFEFDACIVAIGGISDSYGVRGVSRYANAFKSVAECQRIGDRLATLARSRKPRSVVIIGGGLEGVEALGEILRRYRRNDSLRVTVVEAGARLLPGTPPALDAAIRARAAGHAVRFIMGAPVTSVTRRAVCLRSGERLPCDLAIWTGGVTAPPLLSRSGLADGPRQWAQVTRGLQSRRFDNVFVAGDAAEPPRPLAKQAYYAMQMGECAADNVARRLVGRPLRDFRPAAKPMLIAFGDLDTFLVSGRLMIASPALAAAKEAVFQFTMAQLEPPRNPAALRKISRRLNTAVGQLALPALSTGESLARLRRLSLIDLKRPAGQAG